MWKSKCISNQKANQIGNTAKIDSNNALGSTSRRNMIAGETTNQYFSFDFNIIDLAHEFAKL